MTTPTDPMPELRAALGALGRGPGLPEALTGEGGMRLVEWLIEDGVTTAVLADAQASYHDYAASVAGAAPAALRSDMTTILYMRGFQEMPRLMAFLLDAVAVVESPAHVRALAEYLGWLSRRMAVALEA